MPRQPKLRPGVLVSVSQPANGGMVWLPFMVTHVHDDGTISGVGFSGQPGSLDWSERGTQALDNVCQGFGMRQWKHLSEGVPEVPTDDEPEPEPEPDSEPDPAPADDSEPAPEGEPVDEEEQGDGNALDEE